MRAGAAGCVFGVLFFLELLNRLSAEGALAKKAACWGCRSLRTALPCCEQWTRGLRRAGERLGARRLRRRGEACEVFVFL